ncbi:hypothetical protein Y032_0337g2911 [Ancylostoma ceylanicum]|uniref:DUF4440 domain-containing protein n=1 Tax=Ancylostoma ceylanicum TaxID=53326 RepID=A0A016RYC0_9BILA|nr:hypothetical protein Y032_0337g2911 [Ancylostoma ceylanicum]
MRTTEYNRKARNSSERRLLNMRSSPSSRPCVVPWKLRADSATEAARISSTFQHFLPLPLAGAIFSRHAAHEIPVRAGIHETLTTQSKDTLFQEIKNRQQAFMKAFNAGDPKGAAAVYDPDGYFMPNGRHPVKGRAGIEEYFKEDMADGVQTAQIITEEVNGGGDWAFERGSYHLDGTRGRESGAYLQVWKKVEFSSALLFVATVAAH